MEILRFAERVYLGALQLQGRGCVGQLKPGPDLLRLFSQDRRGGEWRVMLEQCSPNNQ